MSKPEGADRPRRTKSEKSDMDISSRVKVELAKINRSKSIVAMAIFPLSLVALWPVTYALSGRKTEITVNVALTLTVVVSIAGGSLLLALRRAMRNTRKAVYRSRNLELELATETKRSGGLQECIDFLEKQTKNLGEDNDRLRADVERLRDELVEKREGLRLNRGVTGDER